jgi:transposase-like protein
METTNTEMTPRAAARKGLKARALRLLRAGKSIKAAAHAINVHFNTVRYWMEVDQDFDAAAQAAIQERLGRAREDRERRLEAVKGVKRLKKSTTAPTGLSGKRLRCWRCTHEWISRAKDGVVKTCPRCQCKFWYLNGTHPNPETAGVRSQYLQSELAK